MTPLKILLVEDEPALLSLLERYLARMGYAVTGCGTGMAARAVFAREGEGIAGAVIDLTLPDGPGEVLAEELRRVRPELLVLFMSGHPSDAGEAAGSGFLQKPFLPGALNDALGKLLREAATGR